MEADFFFTEAKVLNERGQGFMRYKEDFFYDEDDETLN